MLTITIDPDYNEEQIATLIWMLESLRPLWLEFRLKLKATATTGPRPVNQIAVVKAMHEIAEGRLNVRRVSPSDLEKLKVAMEEADVTIL